MQQPSNKVIGITAIVILFALYSMRNPSVNVEINDDETSVSVCHVYAEFGESDTFDDRKLLKLLAVFKMYDFQIGQPVWGPSNTLLYLCEHRLKTGLKQTTIDKELNNVIKNSGPSSKRIAWSCA